MYCIDHEDTPLEEVAVIAVYILRAEADGSLPMLSAITKPVPPVALARLACETETLMELEPAWDMVRSHADFLVRMFPCSMARAAWEVTTHWKDEQTFLKACADAAELASQPAEHKKARASIGLLLTRYGYQPLRVPGCVESAMCYCVTGLPLRVSESRSEYVLSY